MFFIELYYIVVEAGNFLQDMENLILYWVIQELVHNRQRPAIG